MKELIKVTTKEDGSELVSARELYGFLGATERFSAWFERYSKYGFEENVDYVGCKVFNTLAKQELQDYAMTIDMAKEFSMLQKNERGKEARRYFIKRDEILKEVQEELKKIELSNEDKMVKLLSVLPESERGEYMLKLVDRFYPIEDNKETKKYNTIHKDKELTIDKVKDILRQAYDEAYVTTKGGYVIMLKKVVHKYLVSNGIRKHDFNKFVKDNNIAKINKDGYAWNQFRVDGKKNTWEYFIKAELFE